MAKLSLNKNLAKLTPTAFEKYMKKQHPVFAGEWKSYYKGVGGKIPKQKAKA